MHGVPERDGARRQVRRFFVVVVAVLNLLAVDAAAKQLAVARLKGSKPVVVVQGLFDLAYVENRGCAWGMFQGQVWPLAVFGIVALAFLVWKRRSVFGGPGASIAAARLGAVAEPLLYAGIVGNLTDRLSRGFVVDMLDFHWGASHFPCFNLADSYITVSVGLLLLAALLEPRHNGEKAS